MSNVTCLIFIICTDLNIGGLDLFFSCGFPHQMGREQPGEEHCWLGGPRHPVVKEHASLGQSETHEVLGTARPVHGQ